VVAGERGDGDARRLNLPLDRGHLETGA
jgi:hypothetical protein